MSTTSTFISMKNPLNWLRWILMAILALTAFVIVTNGHSQMLEYTELLFDDKLRAFLHLDQQGVEIIALGVLLLGLALLIVTDYCFWVSFDKFRYKIMIIIMAAAVNFFWWNFNQESFKRKKINQHTEVSPPDLKEKTTPYDKQILFIESEIAALNKELAAMNATSDEVKFYVTVEADSKRKNTISKDKTVLMHTMNELKEKQLAKLEEIEGYNKSAQEEYDAALLQAASKGQSIGKGIEILLFSLMTYLHFLSNEKVRVQTGNNTTTTFSTKRKNKTYEIADTGEEKVLAESKPLFRLPSAKNLGVSQKRYDKFADAVPDLIRIAKDGGKGLNEFTRIYCEENPDVKASTLKTFYSDLKANLEEEEEAKEQPQKKKTVVGNIQDTVVEWVKTVKPVNSVARDLW